MLFQTKSPCKSLVAHITHMFVAGHCSTLMTVGWAWLGSRVCLTRKFWQRVFFIFFVCLKQQKNVLKFYQILSVKKHKF
jgi:hypothetical protein